MLIELTRIDINDDTLDYKCVLKTFSILDIVSIEKYDNSYHINDNGKAKTWVLLALEGWVLLYVNYKTIKDKWAKSKGNFLLN